MLAIESLALGSVLGPCDFFLLSLFLPLLMLRRFARDLEKRCVGGIIYHLAGTPLPDAEFFHFCAPFLLFPRLFPFFYLVLCRVEEADAAWRGFHVRRFFFVGRGCALVEFTESWTTALL